MNKLSIFIPTFNRPQNVLETLGVLKGQLQPGVSVVVLDNCSDENVRDFCLSHDPAIKALHENGVITFIRHSANIGMSANFMKAYELCQAEWLSLLSDDDDISSDYVVTILSDLDKVREHSEVAMVKFSSKGCEKPESKSYVTSLDELIAIMAISNVHFNSYIFITNMVYRSDAFRQVLKIGYQSTCTYVPHLMMVIEYLYRHPNQKSVYLSEKQVASYRRPAVGYSYGLVAGLGVGGFKNLMYDLSADSYQKLENVFAAHDDFKVVMDLHFQAKYQANRFVEKRLIWNYYTLIRQARSWPHRVALRCFMYFIRIEFLFTLFVVVISRLSPLIKLHIDEMKTKYTNNRVYH